MTDLPQLCSRPLRSDGRTSTVIYLDQNKWIELARAVTAPDKNREVRDILEILCSKVSSGEIILPLTSSNIYETHKINRQKQRFDLAYTQVILSGSRVFRGYHRRLEIEVGRVLSDLYGLSWSEPDPLWFLSDVFIEATAEIEDPRLGGGIPSKALTWMKDHPKEALFSYLMETPENVRINAIRCFTKDCDELRSRIEERRARHRAESLSMRRRIYSAVMAIDLLDNILAIAKSLDIPSTCLGDKGGATLRALIRDTPALYIEREISLRLEAQDRPVTLNDMRDMRTFCTVLPYADIVIAEQQFTNLARQAALHSHYAVRLETDIRVLRTLL